LCRKLLNSFDDSTIVAYIANSYLSPDELRYAIANELQIDVANDLDQQSLSQKIQDKLLELNHQGKRVVLIIDEAQCLSWDALEAVRLFTNLETEQQKLLQIVLFAQPELDESLNEHALRQIKQRITYSYSLKPLTKNQVSEYISQRMGYAGYYGVNLFNRQAMKSIYKYSKGIPRLVSIICSKALLIAFSKGQHEVSHSMIKKAALDTEGVDKSTFGFFG